MYIYVKHMLVQKRRGLSQSSSQKPGRTTSHTSLLHNDNLLRLWINSTCCRASAWRSHTSPRYRLPGKFIVVLGHTVAARAQPPSVAGVDLWSVAAPRYLPRRRQTELSGQAELGVIRPALPAAGRCAYAVPACALGVALSQSPADVKAVYSLVRLRTLCGLGAST